MARKALSADPSPSRSFLDAQDLVELTNRRRRDAQAKMLLAMGIQHRVRADGTIAVLRAHVERIFGAESSSVSKLEKPMEPNWGAMR